MKCWSVGLCLMLAAVWPVAADTRQPDLAAPSHRGADTAAPGAAHKSAREQAAPGADVQAPKTIDAPVSKALDPTLPRTPDASAPNAAAAPGKTFRDCADCPLMVDLPAGTFAMGSASGARDERPRHRVTLAPFAIGRTEVTQAEWRAVMGSNPSGFYGCDDCPVDSVSWRDVQQYVAKLAAATGLPYRLPSEAEWEYACRAGGTHAFCGGAHVGAIAWTAANSDRKPHRVGLKPPNAFGLYDMSGNVWEWVEDCLQRGYAGAPKDGAARRRDNCRWHVLRGGSWYDVPHEARAAGRGWARTEVAGSNFGVRVVRSRTGSE